jgi:hypothetical protein
MIQARFKKVNRKRKLAMDVVFDLMHKFQIMVMERNNKSFRFNSIFFTIDTISCFYPYSINKQILFVVIFISWIKLSRCDVFDEIGFQCCELNSCEQEIVLSWKSILCKHAILIFLLWYKIIFLEKEEKKTSRISKAYY